MVKSRARRGESVLPNRAVLVRADLLDPDLIVESAIRNHDVYGFYGVSVFAETAGATWMDLAAGRMVRSRWLVLFTAGDLVARGLELWDTGLAPHYDVVHADLPQLVERMLATPHRVLQNPYDDTGGES